MASIDFYDPATGTLIPPGSGLGFFGASFGASVLVNEYQTTTFMTDGNGTLQGPQLNNVKYVNAASGTVGSSTSGIAVTAIPNYQSTLNIRFTHTSAVKTQNMQLRIYDRSDINRGASGVTTKVVEVVHPTTTQLNNGSGATSWSTPVGSSVTVTLTASPGTSGFRPNGANTTDTRHDTYVCISQSPDSTGSKTQNGLYTSLEYV